jgi:hypothetical protein
MTALGHLIEERLAKLKMSRVEFSKRLDISPVSVSAWVREDCWQHCPWFHYPAIATILKVPLAKVLKAAEVDTPDRVAQYHTFMRWQKAHL